MAGRFSNLELTNTTSEAEAIVAPALRGEPIRSAQDYLRQADEAHRSGRFEPALKLFTRALGQDRALARAWVGQVQMLVEMNELAEGRMWADKALELFKNHGDLLAARAQACLRMGDTDAAAAASDAACAAAGTTPFRWRVRGEVMLAGNRGRAQALFRQSLTEPTADWFDRVAIARVCLYHGMPAAGMEFAQEGTKAGARHAYGWFVLGRCQEALGWAEQACVSYGRCMELDAAMPGAREALVGVRSRGVVSRLASRVKGMFSK
jgi:tetratricopeptide (TPR) repeat protein